MHVFAYGSLMFPEVWTRVVRGRYRSAPAQVPDHARFMVRDETYPGAVAAPGQRLAGVLWFDVDAADLARLDRFEGADYRRIVVSARVADGADGAESTGNRRHAAALYLYLPVERLLPRPWLPEEFDMATFLAVYGGMQDLAE